MSIEEEDGAIEEDATEIKEKIIDILEQYEENQDQNEDKDRNQQNNNNNNNNNGNYNNNENYPTTNNNNSQNHSNNNNNGRNQCSIRNHINNNNDSRSQRSIRTINNNNNDSRSQRSIRTNDNNNNDSRSQRSIRTNDNNNNDSRSQRSIRTNDNNNNDSRSQRSIRTNGNNNNDNRNQNRHCTNNIGKKVRRNIRNNENEKVNEDLNDETVIDMDTDTVRNVNMEDNDNFDVETMTNSIGRKLSIRREYSDNTISNESYFTAKNVPSYTDEQSRILAMYENIEHGFIIVCHNSSDVLPSTIECLLKVTLPMCIFVAENGSTSEEKDKMKEICEDFSHRFRCTHPNYQGLNIIYANLNEGSKTLAQFCLLNNLFWFGINIQYVSVIDDDVLIPENWVEEEILSYFKMDPTVKALAYPILASNRREGIVPAFQNFEYTLAMYSKKVHRDIGTVVFPSGAIGTWSVPYLLECLYLHDTVFRGDDLQTGLRLHSLYGRPRFCNPNLVHVGNYKIEMAHVTVDTLVPRCYLHLKECLPHSLGKRLKDCNCGQYSLSRQRIAYWEPARHRFFLKFLECIFHKCEKHHRATITAKLFCIDFTITIINDYLFMIFFAFMFFMRSFLPALMVLCICIAFAYVSLDVFNIVIARGHPTIHLPFEVCVVFPIFYQYLTTLFYRVSTIIYTLTYYVPFVRNKVKIKNRALMKNIGNMTMPDIFTERDSENAIHSVSDIAEFLTQNKNQLKSNNKQMNFSMPNERGISSKKSNYKRKIQGKMMKSILNNGKNFI